MDRLLFGDADPEVDRVKLASVCSTNTGRCSSSHEVVDDVAYGSLNQLSVSTIEFPGMPLTSARDACSRHSKLTEGTTSVTMDTGRSDGQSLQLYCDMIVIGRWG